MCSAVRSASTARHAHPHTCSTAAPDPAADTDTYSYAKRVCFLTRILGKPSRGVAGDPIAAWERHLQPATVTIDSTSASPWEWISFPGASGDCGKTEHRQRGGRKLYRADIGRGRCLDRGSDYSASGQWIPATQCLHAYSHHLQRRRVMRSTLRRAQVSDTRPATPDPSAAPLTLWKFFVLEDRTMQKLNPL
jgi:hypothetical protein